MRILPAAALMLAVSTLAWPSAGHAQSCGPYIILGCFKSHAAAVRRMNELGGPGIGGAGVAGSLGTQVVHTNDYANFRNGFFCVADGPYYTRADAESIAWREAVPDAYVKSGC